MSQESKNTDVDFQLQYCMDSSNSKITTSDCIFKPFHTLILPIFVSLSISFLLNFSNFYLFPQPEGRSDSKDQDSS